jgi:hypothetical protein
VNHRTGAHPTLSYSVTAYPGMVVRHLPGGRRRAAPHYAFSSLWALMFAPLSPENVTQPTQEAFDRLSVFRASLRNDAALPGGGADPAVDTTSSCPGGGVVHRADRSIDLECDHTRGCSACGDSPVVETGEDLQGRPVALCAHCAEAAG